MRWNGMRVIESALNSYARNWMRGKATRWNAVREKMQHPFHIPLHRWSKLWKMNFAFGGIRTHDSGIGGKRLSARPQGLHDRERTTPRQILKHLEIIYPHTLKLFIHKGTIFHKSECMSCGFESHLGQNTLFTIYSIYEVECEKILYD